MIPFNQKKIGLIALSFSFLCLLLLPSTSLMSSSAYSASSMIQNSPISSSIYTGYVVSGNFQSTGIRVKGSWIVPTARCAPGQNSNSTIAVIIDAINGEGDGMTVGTAQNCANGNAQYYAFAIFLPLTTRQRLPTLAIHAGDKIEVQGKWDLKTNFWHAQIIDETTGCNGLSTCKQAISSGRYAAGYLPKMDSGAFLLSNNGNTLTSFSSTVLLGKSNTGIKNTDIVGAPHATNTILAQSEVSGFKLVSYQIPGTTLSPLDSDGGSFQIS